MLADEFVVGDIIAGLSCFRIGAQRIDRSSTSANAMGWSRWRYISAAWWFAK